MKGGRPLVQCASEGSQSCSAATYVGPRYEKTMHDCSIVISPSNRPIRHVPATFSTLPMVPLYPKRQQQRQRRRGRRRRANPFHTLLGYGLWTAVVIAVSQGTSFGIVRLLTSPSMMIWMLTTISTSTLSTTTTMAVAGYKVEAVIGSTFRFPSLARKKNGLVNRRSVSPTSSTAFGVLRTRGGSSSSDDANYDDDDDEVGRMDLDKEPSKNPTRRKPFLSSFIRSLFEVNDSSYPSSNDAPWEHGGDEEEYVPPQPHTTAISSSSSSSSSTLSQSTGRGGALIKEKPTSLASASAPSRVRNPLQWLGSLDIGRVAPFADRLIPEDDEDFCAFQNNNNINDSPLDSQRAQPLSLKTSATKMAETVRASVKSVRRVWWINTWAQQFADHDEDDDVVDKKYLQDDVDGTVVEMDNELEFLSATNIPSEVSDNTSSEDDFEILEDDKNDEDISNDNREDEEESDDDDDDEDDDDDDTGNEDDTGAIAEGSRNESDLYDEDLEGNDTRSFIALNGTVMEDALTISDDTPYVNLPSRPMLTATNVTNDSTEESVYVSSGKVRKLKRCYLDSYRNIL